MTRADLCVCAGGGSMSTAAKATAAEWCEFMGAAALEVSRILKADGQMAQAELSWMEGVTYSAAAARIRAAGETRT